MNFIVSCATRSVYKGQLFQRYGPIAALSYGPAYVDEVGILCDLNARYLQMTPLAVWLVGDLERRGASARERHDGAAHRRVREIVG